MWDNWKGDLLSHALKYQGFHDFVRFLSPESYRMKRKRPSKQRQITRFFKRQKHSGGSRVTQPGSVVVHTAAPRAPPIAGLRERKRRRITNQKHIASSTASHHLRSRVARRFRSGVPGKFSSRRRSRRSPSSFLSSTPRTDRFYRQTRRTYIKRE